MVVGNESVSRADRISALRESMSSGVLCIEDVDDPYEQLSDHWDVSSDGVVISDLNGLPKKVISFDDEGGERALSRIVYGLYIDRLRVTEGEFPDFLRDEMNRYHQALGEMVAKMVSSGEDRQISTSEVFGLT